MMDPNYLQLLIDEEIYFLEDKEKSREEKGEGREVKAESGEEKVGVAFIHKAKHDGELTLLKKIIGACKLEQGDFIITNQDEPGTYSKGVIFKESASIYYQPTVENDSIVLYSKPLSVLSESKEEKAKLWGFSKILFRE